jgi:hypothetical protein
MKNLRLKTRGGDASYIYTTAETGNLIAVSVYYLKMDNIRRRGMYVQVQPEEHKDGCVSFALFSGFSVLAVQAPRKNDKLLAQVATRVDDIAPQVAEMFQTGKKDEAKALLLGMFEV